MVIFLNEISYYPTGAMVRVYDRRDNRFVPNEHIRSDNITRTVQCIALGGGSDHSVDFSCFKPGLPRVIRSLRSGKSVVIQTYCESATKIARVMIRYPSQWVLLFSKPRIQTAESFVLDMYYDPLRYVYRIEIKIDSINSWFLNWNDNELAELLEPVVIHMFSFQRSMSFIPWQSHHDIDNMMANV